MRDSMALVKMDRLSESSRAQIPCRCSGEISKCGITIMNRNGRIIPGNHSPGILMHGGLKIHN
jgi:hypothetical protein